MTEHKREQVSALMDGELDEVASSRLAEDESVKNIWRRYHLISDVIHQRTPQTSPHLAAKISELIKNEPTVLAPGHRSFPAYLRPVAGIAVAASVATLAILGIQQYRNDTETREPVVAQLTVQSQSPVRGIMIPAEQANMESIRPVQMEIQSDAKINRYIMNHNEYQSNAGVQGVMPYVRLVATDNNNND